jgi:hypothetical protein
VTARSRPLLATLAAAAFVWTAVAVAADPLDPVIKIVAADQAHATAALLVRDDLGPAWAGFAPPQPLALKLPVCPAYHPDDSDLTITGHAESLLTLASAGLQVDSDVLILKTAQQVETQFNRIVQPKLATCLKYDLLKSNVPKGTVFGRVEQLNRVRVGTHAMLFRVPFVYQKAPIIADFMFLSQGRTLFFVNIVAPGSAASELAALENRIARTLIKRALVTSSG